MRWSYVDSSRSGGGGLLWPKLYQSSLQVFFARVMYRTFGEKSRWRSGLFLETKRGREIERERGRKFAKSRDEAVVHFEVVLTLCKSSKSLCE